MRKGTNLYDYERIPIYFDPLKEQLLPPEVFLDVTEQAVPGILPYYKISNYGRLWHKYKQEFLTVNLDSKGYPFKPLATKDGPKNCRIHRVLMMTFHYFPGCEDFVIDHLDAIRTNCFEWNLEWVTQEENMRRAKENGSLSKPKDTITPEQVHQVCKLLENPNNSIDWIARTMNVSYTMVSAIQQKRTHCDISDQYSIQPRKLAINFEIEDVHRLCQLFQAHPKISGNNDNYCESILKMFGIPNPSKGQIRAAKKIYQKETYRYVSQDYNF